MRTLVVGVPKLPRWLTLALIGLAAAPNAAAVPAGTTVLVDRPAGFGQLPFDGAGSSLSGIHALSADGRFVVFSSRADALAEGDADDAGGNVYRLHVESGRVEQVNTTTAGAQSDPGSDAGLESISADGRYVAFTALVSGLVPGVAGIGTYVKDMNTGRIELASRGTGLDGAAAGGVPRGVISGDGRHVAFVGDGPLDADNVDGVEGQSDVYVRDLDANSTRMVSVTFNGVAAGGVSEPLPLDIDFTGSAVAFVTESRVGPGDDDDGADAYLRSGIGSGAEQTRLVSFATGQTPGADRASEVALSGGAESLVAWNSAGRLYTAAVSGGVVDKAMRADVARPGGSVSEDVTNLAFEPVAAPGASRRLYFRTTGPLDPADTNGRSDIYSADLRFLGDAHHVNLATSGKASGGGGPGSGAADAETVVYTSESPDLPGALREDTQVYLRTRGADRNISQPLAGDPRANDAGDARVAPNHALSDGGRLVAFTTDAPALGSIDPLNPIGQVVVRDVTSGATELVSATPGGSPGDGNSDGASIDAGGNHVAFVSSSTTLVSGGTPEGARHAYVRNRLTGATSLVDRTAAGAPLDRGVDEARISADGRHLVYLSRSPDAPGAPPGGKAHLYAVDLPTGATELVDRAADGTPADDSAQDGFDLSGDGSRIAFASHAKNLGVAGSPAHQQVYVRDVVAGTTEWASAPEASRDPNRVNAHNPSLSRSGTRVAFQQADPAFGYGMTRGSQVFVRDLGAAVTTRASTDDRAFAVQPSLSADGQRVTFAARRRFDDVTLVALADDEPDGIYLHDLAHGTTTLVSERLDGRGPRGVDSDVRASLDGTGACVAFESRSASALTEPGYGPDLFHVYLRAVAADCPAVQAAPGTGGGGEPPLVIPGGRVRDRDRTRPAISRARVTRRRFAVGRSKTARSAAARGTTFVFTLSEPATTTITVARRVAGRRNGRRCVKPRKGLNRRCTRIVEQVTLTRKGGRAGGNRVAFTGRVGRTTLKPGAYQASLAARDAAGNKSNSVVVRFTVIRARR